MVSKKLTNKFRIKCKIYQAPKNTCNGKLLYNLLKKGKKKFTLNILIYTSIKTLK